MRWVSHAYWLVYSIWLYIHCKGSTLIWFWNKWWCYADPVLPCKCSTDSELWISVFHHPVGHLNVFLLLLNDCIQPIWYVPPCITNHLWRRRSLGELLLPRFLPFSGGKFHFSWQFFLVFFVVFRLVLPRYNSMGMWSPLILVVKRVIQNWISFGPCLLSVHNDDSVISLSMWYQCAKAKCNKFVWVRAKECFGQGLTEFNLKVEHSGLLLKWGEAYIVLSSQL